MADKNLSALFQTLQAARKSTVVGELTFYELTLEQQKGLLSTVFNPMEAPARLSLTFNKILESCITSSEKPITSYSVAMRPMMLRALRDLSIGRNFEKEIEQDGETEKVSFEFLPMPKVSKVDLKEDTFDINGKIIVHLLPPTIQRNNETNKALITQLESIKRKAKSMAEIDRGEVTAQYLIYELIQYIDYVEFNGITYRFDDMLIGEQVLFLNNLPQDNLINITQYIEKIKNIEKDYLKAKNLKTGNIEDIGLEFNFFSKDLTV